MKKLVSTILIILYLATSTGATVNIHYCMGEMYSVNLDHSENCGKCGMEKGEGDCCKDETRLIKVKDSHKPIQQDFSFAPLYVIAPAYDIAPRSFKLIGEEKIPVSNNSPPDAPSLCVLHCVFRI